MPDPDLTPEEQQVRRLLADARLDEPLPDDVTARLEGVLADLGTEPTSTAPVVDLAARRRRRLARNALVAAAAVVVVGVGISRVDLGASGDADSGSAASTAEDDAGGGQAPSAAAGDTARGRVLTLTSDDFDERLDRAGDAGALAARPARSQDEVEQGAKDYASLGAPPGWCNDAAWGRGQRIAVRYDGQPGVLVLRRASGGTRDADLYLCGETTPTRSTTVPAR